VLKRIFTGTGIFVLFAVVLFFRTYFNLPVVFDIFMLLAAGIAAWEIYECFRASGHKPLLPVIIYNFVFLIICYYVFGLIGIVYAAAASTIVLLICSIFSEKSLNDITATLFTMIYPLIFFVFILEINNGLGGFLGIILLTAISCFTDIFAYFTGKFLGKKKLCPNVSPNKTVAGFIGGIIGAVSGAMLVYVLFEVLGTFNNIVDIYTLGIDIGLALVAYIILGIIGALLNTAGDLAASQLKRKCGIKDFGKIFPGHGGVMDRLDGYVMLMPLVALFFYIIL